MKFLKFILLIVFTSILTLTLEKMFEPLKIINLAPFIVMDSTRSQIRTNEEITGIVIHHDAILNKENETTEERISAIAKFHRETRGWHSIAYHYFINSNGEIYQLNNLNEVAPHTENFNRENIGICLAGNFDFIKPTFRQECALIELVDRLQKQFNIKFENVKRHCDLNQTSCPGKLFEFEQFKKWLKMYSIL